MALAGEFAPELVMILFEIVLPCVPGNSAGIEEDRAKCCARPRTFDGTVRYNVG